MTVVQCELYNTSYQASFSFINGGQTINVTRGETPYNPVAPVYGLDSSASGPLDIYYANGSVIPNAYNTTEVQTLSYQAVMDSLGKILVGTISNSRDSLGAIVASNTSVMSTVLGDTKELAFLNNYPQLSSAASTLQQIVAIDNTSWNGVDTVDDTQSVMSLKEALEDLFQNITIGLMSSKLLQYVPP